MRKAVLLYLCVVTLLTAAVASLALPSAGTNLQANPISITQTTGIDWNNTDCNRTFAQNAYLGPQTLPSRIIVEYGDLAIYNNLTSGLPDFQVLPRIVTEYADTAFQLGLQSPQGLNDTGVTPRVIIEYADYASFLALPFQPFPKPQLLFIIGTPTRDPPGDVQENQSVTVWVNITDIQSSVENVSLFYTTTNGTSWNSVSMTFIEQYENSTISLYQATIPGQVAGTWVKYAISAADYAGNYVENDNAGNYFVYPVIPEFPSILILPLFIMTTLLAVIVYRKKSRLSKI